MTAEFKLPEIDFYRRAIRLLQKDKIDFLVGGAYAQFQYSGIARHTKDLDLFIRPVHCRAALDCLARAGYRTEVTAAHWLGKAFHRVHFIDFITGFASAMDQVDEVWFRRARSARVFGIPVKIVAPEEMIWMKCFVQTRERYDGADVVHLLLACHARLDWEHLLNRFGEHWRILLNHVVLFGFVFPGDRTAIPAWVMERLMRRLKMQLMLPGDRRVCQGTLLSQTDYLPDLLRGKYRDVRRRNQSPLPILITEDLLKGTSRAKKQFAQPVSHKA